MKNFIKVKTSATNTAYIVADDVKRIVEIGTEQNGAQAQKTLITFDDGSTLTCIDSAQKIIEQIQGKAPQSSAKPNGAGQSK